MTLYRYIEKVIEKKLEYTDCDGCSRAVAYLLSIAGIEFSIWLGKVRDKDDPSNIIKLHYWIETEDGFIWDFKTYKWLKKESKDCIYMKRKNITGSFRYDSQTFGILVDLAGSMGKKQDELYENITGKELYRKQEVMSK